MNISVSGRHLTVRQDLRELIDKKLSKFDRFFPDGADASVTCRCERDDRIMEITITVGSTIFRAEEAAENFPTALDGCISSIERQIRKNKTRLERRMRASLDVPIEEPEEEHIEEELMFDIRTKTYPIRPMSVEEAILQMNLIGHTFYMFHDAETSKVCVVYKRKGNTYGLIIPEE